jgi:DNA-binding MarR family transcriptional regulator
MTVEKAPCKNRTAQVEGETCYNNDPPNVKLEKSLVLAYIISDKILINSGQQDGLSSVYAGIMYCSYWWRMRMQDIVQMTGVTKSTVTHYVDYLEKKGYVLRVRDGEDRRDVYIQLTDQGRSWVETNHSRMERYLEQSRKKFSKEEWLTLIGLMSRLVGDLDKTPYEKLLADAMKLDFK